TLSGFVPAGASRSLSGSGQHRRRCAAQVSSVHLQVHREKAMAMPAKRFWSFLLGLLGLYAGSAAAQSGFLCTSVLDSGNNAKENAGCIDVLAWSWGQALAVSDGQAGGARTVGR